METNKVIGKKVQETEPTDNPVLVSPVEIEQFYVEFCNLDYVYVAGKIRPPSEEYFQLQIFEALAAKRWKEQIKGITIKGSTYPTDPDSMRVITEAGILSSISNLLGQQSNVNKGIDIGTIALKVNGDFLPVPEEDILFLLVLSNRHIQSVFAIENISRQKVAAAQGFDNKYKAYLNALNRPWSLFSDVNHTIPEATETPE
jgi:hypothetical protein